MKFSSVAGRVLVSMLLLGGACKKDGSVSSGSAKPSSPSSEVAPAAAGPTAKAAMKTYTLFWNVQREPAGGVQLLVDVPPSWGETLDAMGGPTFRADDLRAGISIMLAQASGADAKARVDDVYHLLFKDPVLPLPPREELADGSTWVMDKHDDGSLEARRLMAAPNDKGVVMCIVRLASDEQALLEKTKNFCVSVRAAE